MKYARVILLLNLMLSFGAHGQNGSDAQSESSYRWVHCADEWGVCSLPDNVRVRYGANGRYFTRSASGSIDCTNEFFGDPIVGVVKRCEYQIQVQSGSYLKPDRYSPLKVQIQSTDEADSWIYCAEEWGLCNVPGQATVRYGANDRFYSQIVNEPTIACTNRVFGDPIVGVVKYCEYQLQSSTVVDDGDIDQEELRNFFEDLLSNLDDEFTPKDPSSDELPSENHLTPVNRGRLVFSGHSLTDDSVPTIRAIAADKGVDLEDFYQSIPGSPIRYRTRGANPRNANSWSGYSLGTFGINLIDEFRSPTQLSSGDRYDTLVITERNDILSVIEAENTTSLLRHFHDRLRESDSEGRTYFYQSWLHIDKNNPEDWLEYESNSLLTWECVSSKVNQTLVAEGLSPNVRTLATGWALLRLVQHALDGRVPGVTGSEMDILDQIFRDYVHLTTLGQLFVGAYSFGDIFGQSPEGFPIPGDVSRETGNELLRLAWELVQEYHSQGDRHSRNMSACRDHIASNVCEPYWDGILKRSEFIGSCQSFFGQESDGNPFRAYDPARVVWPSP